MQMFLRRWLARTPRRQQMQRQQNQRTSASTRPRLRDRQESWRILRSTDPQDDIAAFFGPHSASSATRHPTTTTAPISSEFLYDSFRRKHSYLRVSLTERCNLRCKYCMPADGVDLTEKDKLLTHEELMTLISYMSAAGVDKVRFTGGEPLLRPDLARIVQDTVHNARITTNGVNLERKLQPLVDAGLTHLNISLDTLQEDRFSYISRRTPQAHKRCLRAIDSAIGKLGRLQSVKVNVVMMRNVNDDELYDFVEYTRSRPISVRFIEFMPFAANEWKDPSFIPYSEQLTRIQQKFPDMKKISTDPHSTAVEWHVPGFKGTIGFIASMSKPFCGGCSRIRLTSDGFLKTCLFGTDETNLRDPLRDGATPKEILEILHSALGNKKHTLGGLGDRFGIASSLQNFEQNANETRSTRNIQRPMTTIGG